MFGRTTFWILAFLCNCGCLFLALSWQDLGYSWQGFGYSCPVRLGSNLRRPVVDSWSTDAARTVLGSRGLSWAVLGRNWAASCRQVGTRWPCCVLVRLGLSWDCLGSSLGRLGRQIGTKCPSWARLGAVLRRLGAILDATLAASWRPNRRKRSTRKTIKCWITFKIGFGSLPMSFEIQVAGCWAILDALDFQKSWIFLKKNDLLWNSLKAFFGVATCSTKKRAKRPNHGPKRPPPAESARAGEDYGGGWRDLDNEGIQLPWRSDRSTLTSPSSTLVPGGAADPLPRFARRREWVLKSKHHMPCLSPCPTASLRNCQLAIGLTLAVFGVFLKFGGRARTQVGAAVRARGPPPTLTYKKLSKTVKNASRTLKGVAKTDKDAPGRRQDASKTPKRRSKPSPKR